MADPEDSVQPEWSRDTQKMAVLSWMSFLTASACSVLFFAFVDPLVLVEAINVHAIESRHAGYVARGRVFTDTSATRNVEWT